MQHQLDEFLEQPHEERPREPDRQRAAELVRHQVQRGAEQSAQRPADDEDRDAGADLLVEDQDVEQVLLQRDEYPAQIEKLDRQGQQGDERAGDRARAEPLRNAPPKLALLEVCVTHRPAKNADIARVRCARLRVSSMISRCPNIVRMPTKPMNTAPRRR